MLFIARFILNAGAVIQSLISMRNGGREHLPHVWQDMSTGKYYMVNNDTGQRVPCDQSGKVLRKMIPGVSGIASTETRRQLVKKDAAWLEFVRKPNPPRPKPLQTANHTERVKTKGRFGIKLPMEAELAFKERYNPDREAAEKAKDEAAKLRIEEQHRNYAALASSQKSPSTHVATDMKRNFRITRAERVSFTSTGVFRP